MCQAVFVQHFVKKNGLKLLFIIFVCAIIVVTNRVFFVFYSLERSFREEL